MKRLYSYAACLSLLLCGYWACTKAPEYPDSPVITFRSLSKNTLQQGNFNNDSLFLLFDFTDGDGDLGLESSDTAKSIYITDTRAGLFTNTYKIPLIPPQGASNGISGTVTVLLYATCCIYDNGQIPCEPSTQIPTDTVIYELYVKDRAGNKSNVIKTDPIILQCN